MASGFKGSTAVRAARSILSQLHQHTHPHHLSLLQPSRFITGGTKVFVGGISWQTNEDQLRDAFSSFGEVTEARIVLDAESGRSKGYAFVRFALTSDAKTAMRAMNGRALNGKTLRVGLATDSRPRVLGGSLGASRYSDGGDYESGGVDGSGRDGGYGYS